MILRNIIAQIFFAIRQKIFEIAYGFSISFVQVRVQKIHKGVSRPIVL